MTNIHTQEIDRKKCTVHLRNQLLRFVLVGVFNTMLAYAVYALALALGFLYPVANFIALVTGILIGFTTQGKFVFYRSGVSPILAVLIVLGTNLLRQHSYYSQADLPRI